MTISPNGTRVQTRLTAIAFSLLLACTGCTTITTKYPVVPANRLDRQLFPVTKEGKTDIPFTALGQPKPETHIVGAGDLLSIYIFGVFPPNVEDVPTIPRSQSVNQRYYPPNGNVTVPSAGLPVEVQPDGTIQLPFVGALPVEGLSVRQIFDLLRDSYERVGILERAQDRIFVTLVIPRVQRVVVMRQDTPNSQVALVPPGQVDHIHRGSGDVIDLPVYENDVLHALASTGGLPGTDAANEVWVIRREALDGENVGFGDLERLTAGSYTDACSPNVIRIPLRGDAGQPLPFKPEDVVLGDGDVVYLPRRDEYFYTGGLLRGAKVPLPRDEDIDVLEAMTLAAGSVQGPLGQSGQVLAGGRPGYIAKPSRLLILRKLPNGEQLPIEVDLCRAVHDPRERINVQHGDLLILKFRAHQAVFNGLINWINPSLIINTSN